MHIRSFNAGFHRRAELEGQLLATLSSQNRPKRKPTGDSDPDESAFSRDRGNRPDQTISRAAGWSTGRREHDVFGTDADRYRRARREGVGSKSLQPGSGGADARQLVIAGLDDAGDERIHAEDSRRFDTGWPVEKVVEAAALERFFPRA